MQPVQADDVVLRLAQILQRIPSTLGEDHHRDNLLTKLLQLCWQVVGNVLQVRQAELFERRRAELACPRVKHLDDLRASYNLQSKVFNTELCDLLKQLLALRGILEDPALHLLEDLAAAALNHVAQQCEGRTAEAVQRHSAVELLPSERDGLVDVVQALLHIHLSFHDLCVLGIFRVHEWVGEMRALAVQHNDLHSHGLGNNQDVGEDDGGIDQALEAVNRLQSEVGCNFGVAAAFEEVLLALFLVVFGQVAAGLTHHPAWRAFDGLTASGAEEEVILERREGRAFLC